MSLITFRVGLAFGLGLGLSLWLRLRLEWRWSLYNLLYFHSPGGVPAPAVTAARRARPCVAKAAEGPVT